MTHNEFEQWYRGSCPGGGKHAKDDSAPDVWKGDCNECFWELLQAEVASERNRCLSWVGGAQLAFRACRDFAERQSLRTAATVFRQCGEVVEKVIAKIESGESCPPQSPPIASPCVKQRFD